MTENTLRDQFAMAAMQALLTANVTLQKESDPATVVAIAAYKMADRMLAERQKPKANEGEEK